MVDARSGGGVSPRSRPRLHLFHTEDHAGTLALLALVEDVSDRGRWSMIDSGQPKENFVRHGAFEVPIERFRELVWVNTTPATIADANATL
jgi:Leu/Phe-tRNA-protein transferase